MKLYNVLITVTVRLQGADTPQAAAAHARELIERLIWREPLASVTSAQAMVIPTEAER